MNLFRSLSVSTLAAAAALTAGLLAAPVAIAAPAPVYTTYQDCNGAGLAQVAAAGGTNSGLSFYCEKIYTVPGGVAGCPATASDGCIGEYYVLHTRNV
ncbi:MULTISPECIES: hypothetical protein [unclassified Pseudonocardia]|uniref:hypothetical protein n=1 Tax=unclassified Pseudonocardia TaxID=2619320 RepID=UPI0001FFEEA8|nr:hypothetical protein [Pseudonocardia sp. Ae707_Ps1]OLM09230.1 hypothetical protein Ae707Ps1_6177c [Pseudonocardia sp. Ae707_Ps1]